MMTVKHIVAGREDLHVAPYGLSYMGPFASVGEGVPHLFIPSQSEPDGAYGRTGKALYGGTAYVMNSDGATIGSYNLGDRKDEMRAAG